MRLPDTPVLVLAGASHTSLGVIRALGRAGLAPLAAGAGASFVSFSRWHRRLAGRRRDDPTPQSLAAFLNTVTVPRMVLLACSDAWVAAVAQLDSSLAKRFPSSLAPVEALDACLDKARFTETMMRLGLPHARTLTIDADDDIRTLWNEGLRDPFLKPRNSGAFLARFGAKGIAIQTVEQGAWWYARRATPGSI